MFVERWSGFKIKILRTDNGKEYVNNSCNYYLKYFGTKHELTIPYTRQQNGVAERKNITIIEMVRCLLHGKKIDYKFWVKAMACATNLINRTPKK